MPDVAFVVVFRKMSGRAAIRALLCCGLLLWPAAIARADGLYQRTRDGKTLVWNDSPKPGDSAKWAGDRDNEGYATGFGTLTWYTSDQHDKKPNERVYAYYFGNVVHGKLNGPVNGHSKGVTSHALFVQGKRTTRWASGPAPSWRIPQATPEGPNETLAAATIEKAKPVESNPPRTTYDRPASNRPIPDFHSLHQESVAAPPDVAEGPDATAREAAGQSTAALSPQSKPKIEMDASLRSLTGPPLALRDDVESASQSESNAKESSPPTAPQLSKQDAIELADAQAQQRGYDPAKYRRPDPQFDATDNTWTLSYEKEPNDDTASSDKRLTIAIDDKTKRTAIVAGH
ncbi:MAG TPA: hypothetical protein VGM62_18220 [Chthoniobacterales bacterium]|jgi:hypothetical protein